MKVDILFISFNRKDEVQFNLDKMSKYDQINKIIWVDNGSKDGIDSVSYDKSKVTFVNLEQNIGIKAYNIGATHSDAEILIILDDDSHVEEDAIGKTVQRFNDDPLLGALAYKIILPDTNENVTKDWNDGDATYFWGCGAAVRRSVWQKLGGYREELFLYGNEYDLCIRIWNEGFKVQYTSEIGAYHRVSSMNRTSDRLVSFTIRNNYIYIKTYFDKKFHKRLFFYDRLTWFIRALLSGSGSAFFQGLKMTESVKNSIVHYPIDLRIQQYYIDNQRIFENPVKKILRKSRHGLLFKVSKSV